MTGVFPLGPAEQHVVDELLELLDACVKGARELLEKLEQVDTQQFEVAVQDADRRKLVIQLVAPLRSLSQSLAFNQLLPVLIDVALKPKEPA